MGADQSGRFSGKVAIVTGSTRGIGLATATLLAAQGATVVISSRKEDQCAAVCDSLLAANLKAIAVHAHIGNHDDTVRLVQTTVDQLGRLDIVISNAGVNPVFDPLEQLSETAWAKVIDINLSAPWRLASAALPHIARQGGGAMVMVSSINSFLGIPGSAAYGIAKAGLNQLTRQLAVECGARDVRVNAVAPGTTRTDMIRALAMQEGWLEAVKARTPLARVGEPEDIAATIAFLASEEARHITGQLLVVDGGETIARSSGGLD